MASVRPAAVRESSWRRAERRGPPALLFQSPNRPRFPFLFSLWMNPERANTAVIRAKRSDDAQAFVRTAFLKVVTFVGTYGMEGARSECAAPFNVSRFQGKLTLEKPAAYVRASLGMSSFVLFCGPLFFYDSARFDAHSMLKLISFKFILRQRIHQWVIFYTAVWLIVNYSLPSFLFWISRYFHLFALRPSHLTKLVWLNLQTKNLFLFF